MIAEVVIGRVALRAAGVADTCANDCRVTPEPGVGSPESTEAERRSFDDGGLVEIEWEHHDQYTAGVFASYARLALRRFHARFHAPFNTVAAAWRHDLHRS